MALSGNIPLLRGIRRLQQQASTSSAFEGLASSHTSRPSHDRQFSSADYSQSPFPVPQSGSQNGPARNAPAGESGQSSTSSSGSPSNPFARGFGQTFAGGGAYNSNPFARGTYDPFAGLFRQPPKEQLLEKYNSVELKSAAERHKMELQRTREAFQRHEGDCGSTEVQTALLTDKIKYMAQHMQVHKKDKHSRKGLEGMLAQRRKLLKYLRRTDWDAYVALIARLGLRDQVTSGNKNY